ncbi:alpha/beta hydrolase [Draconibacterium sp.]|nr:alpha/beta hydrolase [Draconibacterium sp.]
MKRGLIFLIVILFFGLNSQAQSYSVKKKNLVYKEVDGVVLEMTIYTPDVQGDGPLPAIVFFFGGGWVSGTPTHFQLQAEYLASRGIVAICPDYRTKNKHNTSPFECVKDARSAMRYIKMNGKILRVDPDKVVAAGGSAGGHLACCTAMIDNVNEEGDNLQVSPNPFALVLFNPVVDTSKKGYGQSKMAGREFEISPVHHITSNVPSTLIMHGKDDTTVPFENVKRFDQTMKQAGNECKLVGYNKQGHGFFNYNKKPKYFKKTLTQTEKFLEGFELLKGVSWVTKYCKELEES